MGVLDFRDMGGLSRSEGTAPMFDAYHKWLGIPPDQRPPTYYQLLGIAPGEGDSDVIEAAALRQMAFVRHFQTGPHARDCARVLGELSQARLTLLDDIKRAAYDALLAQSSGANIATVTLP